MQKIILNIGLENNKYDFQQISQQINKNKGFVFLHSFCEVGFYNGVAENTVILYLLSDYKTSKIIEIIENLCLVFTQECISLKIDNIGYLIYSPTFSGKKYNFESNYFITSKKAY